MADAVDSGKNKSNSRNAQGRGGKNQEEPRSISKQTQLSESEAERIDWARKELGLDWSSFLRYAALQITKQVIG